MEEGVPATLVGGDIHGFHTTADLNIEELMEDASKRWLRPNEIHAILSNYTRFKIQPQPVLNPESGSLLLFDRTMLRNFRKDGHNWKKKKDGKTVQEAHEKLKIGAEEKIHVYYARGEDDPNFQRRCYWLLERNLGRIVLVHYRQTLEDGTNQNAHTNIEHQEDLPSMNILHHGSPLTRLNSTSGSSHSEMSRSVVFSEEINSGEADGIYGDKKSTELGNHGLILDEINTLDWEALVGQNSYIDSSAYREGDTTFFNQQMVDQKEMAGAFTSVKGTDFQMGSDTMGTLANAALQSQNSFGQWSYIMDDPPGSLDGLQIGCQVSKGHVSNVELVTEQFSIHEQVFSITDVSPSWSYSNEETKVIVVGYFHDSHKHLTASNVFCVFGDTHVAAEMVQPGVYRCMTLPHSPGLIGFCLSLDGHTPMSQVMNFEFRASLITELNSGVSSTEVDNTESKSPMSQVTNFEFRASVITELNSGASSAEVDNTESKPRDFGLLTRLAHLLFSTTNSISILSNKISPNAMKEAKRFASTTTSSLEKDWIHLLELIGKEETSSSVLNENFLELVLKNKLQEWLLAKVAEGRKTTALDHQGLGVIHLCAILEYTWAARLFSVSGLSVDFRDAFGWTALHWAAYCGRVKMVAALLSARANPSLVTDPTPEFPGGCIAADLASQAGYEGLGAYLAEHGLRAHFKAMTLSGNIAAPLPHRSTNPMNTESMDPGDLSEQELCLKDSLAAYRNAADAADRIQAAFRERSLKLQLKAAQSSNSEAEIADIIAALKIQKAYRNYNRRKMMKAAARIQGVFRTWQARRNFVNMRRQAVKIQAVFRGHQVRRQYHKIIWSVGVLEKAVLRWRLKRKGLRGIQVESTAVARDVKKEEACGGEEDFYRIGREQAEDRVRRSVVRVQAMFRSYRAQQEYRKMKLAYDQAELEYNELAEFQ